MKKSRITKLALSGAAVAALAATFSTSTYAWYVSNKTANVNAVTGMTDSAAGDGSISLSTTGVADEYFKTISLTAANYNGTDSAVKLAPVTTTTGNTFIKDDGTPASTSSYYKYEFYIKAETGCEVIPTITVSNTTVNADIPYQINYSSAAQSTVTGVEKGASFTIDALYALYISQSTQIGTTYSATQTTYTAASSQTGAISTPQADAVDSGARITPSYSAAITALAATSKATAGAHAYYTEIMATAPSHVEADLYTAQQGTASIGNITLTANTPQKVTYYLWLDGADDQCFNSCAGQNLSVSFSYTVKANN